ncbi:MAG: HD domain-containing protein [Negativicutes bacterium]|nr:HD domain-containing protein [Negativicutes bacterium]
MRKAILELLPEINWIQNLQLCEAVVDSYVDALTEGGWEPSDMDKIPFALAFPNCPTSYLCHVKAVTRMCRMILEEYNSIYQGQGDFLLDNDRLIAGALLHDVGKFVEWKKGEDGNYGKSQTGKDLRHPISGTVIAMRNGIPSDIAHIVAYHAHEGDGVKRSPEAVIVNKVDMMNFDSIRSHLGHL